MSDGTPRVSMGTTVSVSLFHYFEHIFTHKLKSRDAIFSDYTLYTPPHARPLFHTFQGESIGGKNHLLCNSFSPRVVINVLEQKYAVDVLCYPLYIWKRLITYNNEMGEIWFAIGGYFLFNSPCQGPQTTLKLHPPPLWVSQWTPHWWYWCRRAVRCSSPYTLSDKESFV